MRRMWSLTLLTAAAALSLRPRGATKRPATPAVREKELNLPPFDLGANLSETLDEAAARADRFKEEAVSSDTPVGEIFRPQQAVRTK